MPGPESDKLSVDVFIDIGEAIALVFRDVEIGVCHPERFEDVAGDELHIILAGDDLDDAAEHGDADVGVHPLRAGFVAERLVGVGGDRILEAQAQGLFVIGDVAHRVGFEAGGVVHQLPDSRRSLRRMGGHAAVGQSLLDWMSLNSGR